MVMLHLMRKAGFSISVAHVNFGLRAEESDADETFVRAACEASDVRCYVRGFDTRQHATARGISIQMAARDLRYAFFQEVAAANGYDFVATGHHFSDLIESVLLNLSRGTGIDGFRGIAAKKGNIIRPLLFATRREIRAYAAAEGIAWREDTSNASDDYPRNLVRHHIVPRFEELNPGFEEGFRETHDRMMGARALAGAFIESFKASWLKVIPNGITLDIEAVREAPFPAVLLWEVIKPYGFHYDHCKQIVRDHQAGKRFTSDTHELVVDRTTYIIAPVRKGSFPPVAIEAGQRKVAQEGTMLQLEAYSSKQFKLRRDATIAQLDADRVRFPLVWRKWEAGDYFVPLGMHAEKKLSDFLIDLKIPFNAKADITVLESGGDIVWVVGYRIDERYKITPETERILVVQKFP